MKQFSNTRVICFLVIVLFCFMLITAFMVSYQQKELLRKGIFNDIKGDLDLIADASLEPLLKSDYVTVRNFIKQWGNKRKEFHELQIVAPNGFVIAGYRSPEKAAGETYSLTKDVMIGQALLATIHLYGDYCETDTIAVRLRNRLVFAAFIITILLGISLWLIFRELAIVPLEDEINERTCALSDANQELEQLAENSPT